MVALVGGTRRAPPGVATDGVPRAVTPTGATLRFIMRQNASNGGIATTTTFEITELSHAPLDASIFSVPANIETIDLRERMRQLPPGLFDSVTKATMSKMPSGTAAGLCGRASGRLPNPPR